MDRASSIDGDGIRLLEQLAGGESSSGAERILARMPEWESLKNRGVLQGPVRVLSALHHMGLKERCSAIPNSVPVMTAFFSVLKANCDRHATQYTLTCIYDAIRDDCSTYDKMLTVGQRDILPILLHILNDTSDGYTANKSAFLCSGFISRAPAGFYEKSDIHSFSIKVCKGGFALDSAGRLGTLANLLKLNALRNGCWVNPEVPQLLMKNLQSSTIAELYPATFCVWLLSFDVDALQPLVEKGVLNVVCNVLKQNRNEKVIRLCTRIVVNCLRYDSAVELIIEQNTAQCLTLLEYEKWRDQDTYTEIQDSLGAVHLKMKQLSNFDRYKRELAVGTLKQSFLHTEKFWLENVMLFEENEFEAIKLLVGILKSDTSSGATLAVACFDLGEFARLHPTAKRMLAKLQVKNVVLSLMSHTDREVCREALLCTQKLMLDRWQVIRQESDTRA